MKVTGGQTVVDVTHAALLTDERGFEHWVQVSAPLADYITPFDGGDFVFVALNDEGPLEPYEWPEGVEFIQGNRRNINYCDDPDQWFTEQRAGDKAVFLVGIYEHGLVSYELAGESIHSGDQFDYSVGAAIAIPTGDSGFSLPEEAARSILKEYTAWCNGDSYAIAKLSRLGVGWTEEEVVWGFLGSENVQRIINSGGF